jgi:adenosine deaminase
MIDRQTLLTVPKVILHEHLDGALRPSTVLELARECGYGDLPENEPGALGRWFFAGAARGSLPAYLEGFRHTIAVMQTTEALERVAWEFIEDVAAEGTVYAEVRFAPHFHTQAGLGLDAVMGAVNSGLAAAGKKYDVDFGVIVCALRNQDAETSLRLAELAAAWMGRGCVGFDLAGEEAGHPAKDHLEAFQLIKRMNGSITIHAGESFGPESIWQALQYCGAHRIGHGTRLVEDMVVYEGKVVHLGPLARYLLDHRVTLEMCISSNVHTGATPSIAEHPFPHFLRAGYRVTLNCDNRLMSDTSMTREFELAVQEFGCTLEELERITLNGIRSAFLPYRERVRVIEERVRPGYAALGSSLGGREWPTGHAG